MAGYRLLLISFLAAASTVVVADEQAKCDCGVFKYPTSEKTEEAPIVSKAPSFNFECDADGKESCSNMCKALAGASKDEGPKRICQLLHDNSEPFTPVVYYKACDDKSWSFTGLKSTLEICCKNSEPVACA